LFFNVRRLDFMILKDVTLYMLLEINRGMQHQPFPAANQYVIVQSNLTKKLTMY
jgi:hypothetical protein